MPLQEELQEEILYVRGDTCLLCLVLQLWVVTLVLVHQFDCDAGVCSKFFGYFVSCLEKIFFDNLKNEYSFTHG